MDDLKKARKEMDALRKAGKKTEQKELHKILKALQKENALKKAEEKTEQKEGHKILKEDAFRKAEGKRIAALIKAQERKKSTNTVKRLEQKFASKIMQEKKIRRKDIKY